MRLITVQRLCIVFSSLALAGLGFILAKLSSSHSTRSPATVRHFSFRRSDPKASKVWPVGDQRHGWAFYAQQNELRLLDSSGSVKSSIKAKNAWSPLLDLEWRGTTWLTALTGTDDPWVLTPSGTLGTAHPVNEGTGISLTLADGYASDPEEIAPSKGNSVAWVLSSKGRTVSFLRASAGSYRVYRTFEAPEPIRTIVSSADGKYFWATNIGHSKLYVGDANSGIRLAVPRQWANSEYRGIGPADPIDGTDCAWIRSFDQFGSYTEANSVACANGALSWPTTGVAEIAGLRYWMGGYPLWAWSRTAGAGLLELRLEGKTVRVAQGIPIEGLVRDVFFDAAAADGQRVFVISETPSGQHMWSVSQGRPLEIHFPGPLAFAATTNQPNSNRLYVQSRSAGGTTTIYVLSRVDYAVIRSLTVSADQLFCIFHPDKLHVLTSYGHFFANSTELRVTDIDLNEIATLGAVPRHDRSSMGYFDGTTYWSPDHIITGRDAIDNIALSLSDSGQLTWHSDRSEEWSLALPSTGKIESATLRTPAVIESEEAVMRLELVDAENGKIVNRTPDQNLKASGLIMQLNWRPDSSRNYNCRFIYRIPGSYYAETEWRAINFPQPILDRPRVRTLVLYALLVLLAAALFRTPFLELSVRRWLPLLVAASAGGSSESSRIIHWVNIDEQLLLALLGATFLAAVTLGVLSTKAFRSIAQLEPFHALVPIALTSDRLRSRLYAEHVRETLRQVGLQRDKLNGEYYAATPCDLFVSESQQKSIVMFPVEELLAQRKSVHTLITGPGGRGKSALLRQTTIAACALYERDCSRPIPVLSSATGATMIDLVANSLGASAFPRDILAAELSAGHFMLLIDGLTEGTVDATTIGKFLKSDSEGCITVICSARPSDAYQEAFVASRFGCLLTPRMLDDACLAGFQEAYIEGDRKNGIESFSLSGARSKVCRSTEGTYLPILVRLCMQLPEDVFSLAEVYDKTFARLLGIDVFAASAKIDAAAELCVDTYWKTGVRSLAYARAAAEKVGLLDTLVKANILVPLKSSLPRAALDNRPEEVKFFHDSMQSYLTARGLLKGGQEWSEILRGAATAPRFRARSDRDIPEVFQMCLEVFGPQELLIEVLKNELLKIVPIADKQLSKNKLLSLSPVATGATFAEFPKEQGVGEMLKLSVQALSDKNGRLRDDLGLLFAAVALALSKSPAAEANDDAAQSGGNS